MPASETDGVKTDSGRDLLPRFAIAMLAVACACGGKPDNAAGGGQAQARPHGVLSGQTAAPALSAAARAVMSTVPAGSYTPVYTGLVSQPEAVAPFLLDRYPVTNSQYLQFVEKHPDWRIGQPPAIKAGPAYLRHWRLSERKMHTDRTPVRNVSWFAARAYCRSLGKRLPTIAEWERAAMAPDRARPLEGEAALVSRVLQWYGTPNQARPVGSVYENIFGVFDMHGSVWEWTEDFNSVTIDPDGRANGKSERFCGGGGFNASNPRDYAAFMRQAFRSGLNASSTTDNLGFRCAADAR